MCRILTNMNAMKHKNRSSIFSLSFAGNANLVYFYEIISQIISVIVPNLTAPLRLNLSDSVGKQLNEWIFVVVICYLFLFYKNDTH